MLIAAVVAVPRISPCSRGVALPFNEWPEQTLGRSGYRGKRTRHRLAPGRRPLRS
jgi:hypothetical protein